MAGPLFPKKEEPSDGVSRLGDIPHHERPPSPSARWAIDAARGRGQDRLPLGVGRQQAHLGDYRRRGESPRARSASPIVPPYHEDENSLFVPESNPIDLPATLRGSQRPRTEPRSSTSTTLAQAEPREGECTCPISYDCPRRTGDKLDCRPLVHTFMRWNDSIDQEAYIRQITTGQSHSMKLVNAQRLRQGIRHLDCVENLPISADRQRKIAFEELRAWVLKMYVCDPTEQALNTSQLLPRISAFIAPENKQNRESKKIPVWFEEQLTFLYRKWYRGNYSSDPKRGLNKIEVLDQNNTVKSIRYTLDKTWSYYVDARYFGEHVEEDKRLVNGQIWYTRQELMRDGAHSMLQAGVSGTVDRGAYSVVMGLHLENSKYADIDFGEVIEYEGTSNGTVRDEDTNIADTVEDEGQQGKLTTSTRALMKSLETGTPVRVIRSFKLAPIVTNRPIVGYRYDGLYRVTRQTLQKSRAGIWSFRMERLKGQGTLRGFGKDDPPRPSNGTRKGKRTQRSRLSIRG